MTIANNRSRAMSPSAITLAFTLIGCAVPQVLNQDGARAGGDASGTADKGGNKTDPPDVSTASGAAGGGGRSAAGGSGTPDAGAGGRGGAMADAGPGSDGSRDAIDPPGGFEAIVTEGLFNQMFPNRNQFYTYAALVAATRANPTFANTGDITTRKREAAAFLANAAHETGGLSAIEEVNKADDCSAQATCACASGKRYFGRGPLQLTWNYNYCAAGQALGLSLQADPDLVGRDVNVAYKTSLWFWMTQVAGGTMTAHNAMTSAAGFGQTIRTINGGLECGGANPAEVQSRVDYYNKFVQLLGVTAGNNVSC